MRKDAGALIPAERLEREILVIRGQRVLLDVQLAGVYGVTTKVLNQAVRRNIERFPRDFMFRLDVSEVALIRSHEPEADDLRSQFVTSSWGGRRPRPYAEQGVAMLSSVLRSPRAVAVNIEIMRAFVRLRRLLGTHEELARKIAVLEAKYNRQFKVVFDAIRALMEPPEEPEAKKPPIGFRAPARA